MGISSVHFALKSEKEQEAMLAAYAAVLNGISYPLQILTQVRPLNLAPYLALVREERARTRVQEHDAEMTALWDRLTEEYIAFVTGMTSAADDSRTALRPDHPGREWSNRTGE